MKRTTTARRIGQVSAACGIVAVMLGKSALAQQRVPPPPAPPLLPAPVDPRTLPTADAPQTSTPERQSAIEQHGTPEELNAFSELITDLVRENIPLEYEDRSDWGGKKRIVTGLFIKRNKLKLETHRTYSEKNHGTWKMYRIQLLDPAEQFRIDVENVHTAEDGRLGFDLLLSSRLEVLARLAQWQTGVQLISVGSEADALVRMRLSCLLRSRLDITHVPPEVLFDPEVASAEIDIVEFHLHNLSRLNGPLVDELSNDVHDLLERQVAKKREHLVTRMNRAIDKRQDRLRLSVRDLLASSWGQTAAQHLGLAKPE
ncbi:MAG: hypothetical protein KDA55_08725 [Planctomycetales bacterium]|nr:hypothetical protein [Planctomycetales bacterium]